MMTENHSPALRKAIAAAMAAWRPPPRLLVSEWAGQYRHLSPEASAEPGLWNNARASHLVAPMDCLSPHSETERVVCKFSSQTGKTEILLNFIGYIIDMDPGPTLALQPNVSPMGEAFSKDRIVPMLRDSPTLAAKVGPGLSRTSAQTITHKSFPSGHLSIVGANSAAGLASRPIRYLLIDEIDRAENTKEGDPLTLARKRLQTFRVRRASKELIVSSPTYADVGVSVEYEKCSQLWEWHLFCLRCGDHQRPQLKHFEWDAGKPKTVQYVCEACTSKHQLAEADKVKARGRWVCTRNEGKESVGFWMNQWSSPFARWDDTIEEWEAAGDDPMQRQVVTNTAFAEPWEGEGERVEGHILEARAEEYPAEVPEGVAAITIGVDVQKDRIEAEVVGWGEGEECWSLGYIVSPCDPTNQESLNQALAEVYATTWAHANGCVMSPSAMCVDAGNWSQNVYAYVLVANTPRVIPVKGLSNYAADAITGTKKERHSRAVKRMMNGRPVEPIGVGQIKRLVYSRLAVPLGDAGCCHFPKGRSREYYDQLTGERLTTVKKRGNRPTMGWVPVHANVEALDCRVYAYAALLLSKPDLSAAPMQPGQRAKTKKRPAQPKRRERLIR